MNRDTLRRWGAQLNRIYRVSFVDDETLNETRRYILKPKTILISSILLLFFVIGLTASLIVFTPVIREQIPGYLNPQYEIKQNEMLDKIASLQDDIESRDSLINVLIAVTDGVDSPDALPQRPADAPSQQAAPSKPVQKINAQPAEAKQAKASFVKQTSSRPAMLRLFLPVDGKVRNAFNQSTGHYGVDIAAKEKAPVKAATSGIVVFSEYSDRDGHVIGITSGDNVLSLYKHNSSILKQVGQYVQAGETIAIVGNTGENTNGPHLHFEVWRQGKAVDPVPFFPEWQ
ncbi:MAG: M23 family metallopeptidase [Bacteroidia bacterium]